MCTTAIFLTLHHGPPPRSPPPCAGVGDGRLLFRSPGDYPYRKRRVPLCGTVNRPPRAAHQPVERASQAAASTLRQQCCQWPQTVGAALPSYRPDKGRLSLCRQPLTTVLVIHSDGGSEFTSVHFHRYCQATGSWMRSRIKQVGAWDWSNASTGPSSMTLSFVTRSRPHSI